MMSFERKKQLILLLLKFPQFLKFQRVHQMHTSFVKTNLKNIDWKKGTLAIVVS